MKTSKKVISLVLTAIMVLTTFVVAAPMLLVDTNAATTIDGVTQERVVGTDGSYATTYDNYAAAYLNGASSPTNIVIPGLNAAQDYVIQGMTYYHDRDWMLVTAYHNVAEGETTQSSKVFALDAATGEFVAMFSFKNVDGSENTDHGGGIAVSEHNIYYSCGDKDRKIAYAPLSALADAPLNAHTQIQLVDEIDFVEVGSISSDSKTAYTAYVCYDQGILWMGNFYDLGAKLLGVTIAAADYNAPSNNTYNSMVFGYKLAGNSSAEEWDHLKGKFQNLVKINTASGTGSSNGSTFTWNAYQNGNNMSIVGDITAPTAIVGEFVGNSVATFTLTEGVNYTIEFTSTNINTDMYMFSPAGTHSNVKQSSQTTITQLEDGRYHYSMNFTAGLKPTGADSAWPTTQSTDGSYTGTYTLRFDQDYISVGETREFAITDIKVAQTNTYENGESVHDEGSVGSPSYALGLNNELKDVQYATVDNGKLYLSRSYGSGAGNSINFGFGDCSYLTVADIDLSAPGDTPVTISTQSTGSLDKTVMAYDISNFQNYPMMPMSEGLCVIEGNIFITFEGASNKYLNESSGLTSIGNCEKPVDVIWQLDPYELMETTVVEPEESIYYEKVNSLSEIKDGEEYIIVHESQRKDPVTQKNYLYALNADGNFKDYKLSKSASDNITGYNGMIGHPISYYSYEEIDGKEILYLEQPEVDDVESVRWEISKQSDGSYRFKNTETYFANCNYLFFDNEKISMAPGNTERLKEMSILESGNGKGGFWLSNNNLSFLWCNDGTTPVYNQKINSYYITNSGSVPIYSGISEIPGTMHCDALNWGGSTNIIGGPILTGADTFYEDGVFYIYRRVVDSVASTYESRVYTDLDAELQEDGTYKVTLETYAISPNHYQYVGERPTDYIIVADTSSSMASTGSTGIIPYNGGLKVSSLSIEANTSDDNGTGVSGYGFSNPDEEIYYLHTDGKYYQVRLAVNTTELKKVLGIISSFRQLYWAYFIADDGLYYVLQSEGIEGGVAGGVWDGISATEFKNNVDNGVKFSEYSTKTSNGNRRDQVVFTGPHYRFATDAGEFTRLSTLQTAANDLIDQIAAQSADNRIALVQYGADASSGFYNTSGTLSTTDYANAFWSASAKDTLKTKVSALATSEQTNNSGLEMRDVNNIIANAGVNYKSDGTRNVAVIFLTDGIPGADGNGATATAANNVISSALTAKNNGAFIYSVLIGNNNVSGFNKKGYMDGVSSKYAAAQNLDTLGGMSVDGVNYAMSLATATMNNFVDFGELTTTEVKSNTAVGLDNLDANSYLREQLNDAFKFPEDGSYSVDVDLITGEFDEIGRFSFKDSDEEIAANATDAAKIVCNTDVTNKTITVTNYHYAKEYIAKNRTDEGRKLRVTITGLLADETAQIQNTSINNTDTTGLFKTKGNMDNNVAFKYLPTAYFNIPEYTYVLDYGLPMYDADVNGTLKSVSADLSRQRDANGNLAYNTISENGLVEIAGNSLDLIYRSTPTNFADSGYCLIQRDDGTYDWFEIKVVPASNVLFEENYLNDAANSTGSAWSTSGTTNTNYQSVTNDETDVYGYDNVYANSANAHSYGSAAKATVSTSAKRSATKTFDFVGDGIDLISACGANTGIMIVKISGGDLKSPKAYIVDTYYDGDYVNSDGLACQTPIVNFRGNHGTYTVEVTAAYLSNAGALKKSVTGTSTLANGKLSATTGVPVSENDVAELLAQVGMEDLANADLELVWFDDNSVLNGGTGAKGNVKTNRAGETTTSLDCYIDGFRTYNPLETANDDYIENEKDAQYINVIDSLKNNQIGTDTTSIDGIAYVAGAFTPDDETGAIPTLSFANYQSVGPQNELYLNGNSSNAIVIKVQIPALTSKVQLGLRAVTGTATVKVGATQFDINSATEMYYDVTNCVSVDEAGVATITIQNTGSSLLAVNNIKLTGDATAVILEEADLQQAAMFMAAPAEDADIVDGVVTPIVPEDDTNDDTTQPDNGDDNTSGDDSGTTDSGSSNLSFIEQIIAMIMEIFASIFKFLPVGGVA